MAEIAVVNEAPGGGSSSVEQPSPASGFDFSSLHEKAMNYGTEASTPSPAADVAADAGEQAQVEEADVQNVDNASATQLAQLKDTDLVEVTVDGQPVQMPWSEARGGVMRQAKFTKEMQRLASDRSQFESQQEAVTQLKSEREALVELLSNPQLLQQFAAQKYPDLFKQVAAAAQAAASGPDGLEDIATVGQIEQVRQQAVEAVQNVVQQLQSQLDQREAAIAEKIETKQATLKLATEINNTIQSLFKENDFINKTIPNAEQLLRYEVSKMRPQTAEETLEAFRTVVGGWKERFDAAVKETTKQSVVVKQKLTKNNIQPPGGAGVQPQPTNFQKVNKLSGKQELDWDALHNAALAKLG